MTKRAGVNPGTRNINHNLHLNAISLEDVHCTCVTERQSQSDLHYSQQWGSNISCKLTPVTVSVSDVYRPVYLLEPTMNSKRC
jgi:hypothetical protein